MSDQKSKAQDEKYNFEVEVKKLSSYADQKLDKIFRKMLGELFKEMPEDPIQVAASSCCFWIVLCFCNSRAENRDRFIHAGLCAVHDRFLDGAETERNRGTRFFFLFSPICIRSRVLIVLWCFFSLNHREGRT